MDKLERYFSDEAVTEALADAGHDRQAAWDTLLYAAGYFERDQPLPGDLANYLARAINAAMAVPIEARLRVLTDQLNLTVSHRPPSFDQLQAALDAYDLIENGATQESAYAIVAERYGCSAESIKGAFRRHRCDIKAFLKTLKKP